MAVKTPSFIIQNMPWYLTIYKSYSDHLEARLSMNGAQSCTRTILIKLISIQDPKKSIVRIEAKRFSPFSNLSIEQLMSWRNLMKPENGFVHHDSVKIEVDIVTDYNIQTINNFKESNVTAQRKVLRMECVICMESIENQDLSFVPCGHLFCTPCITRSLEEIGVCPLCIEPARVRDLRRAFLPL